MSTAIKLTLPDSLAQKASEHVKNFGYANLQELTLAALREKSLRLDGLAWLEKNRASVDVSELSAQERALLANSFSPEVSLEALRKFNLN